jgi:diguanylate cyclase (GGDEF)-like protein
MTLRILLVESGAEELLYLRDVLDELEGADYWSGWTHLDVLDAPTLEFAEAILATETIDVVLLNPDLPDSHGSDTCRAIQSIAPHVPVVLLVGHQDRELAERLVREGAQDFLLRRQIDCEPIAHAIRGAVDRQRLLIAARTAAVTDPLTGLLNRTAFYSAAERDRRLAEELGRPMVLLVAEPRDFTGLNRINGDQQRDLAVVETAECLRTLAAPTDVVGRIGETRFAIVSFLTNLERIEQACVRFQRSRSGVALSMGTATFDPPHKRSLDELIEQAVLSLTPLTIGPEQAGLRRATA